MSIASGYGPNWSTDESRGLDAQRRIAELEQQLAAAQAELSADAKWQAVIDQIADDEDRMHEQIELWARQSYRRSRSGVRGTTITRADSEVTHYVWAALRWAHEREQAEVRELRAELARVRGNRTEAELRQLKHDLETAGISAFMSPEKLPKEEWYSSAAFCRDVVRRARYVVEDMIVALSQPAERESLPLMARSTCLHLTGSGGGLGDTPVTVGGTRYLVADTDEHGLPVIPRTAGIPEGAMYYVAGEYFSALPSRAIREMDQCFRIEDYRPAAQEGCHG